MWRRLPQNRMQILIVNNKVTSIPLLCVAVRTIFLFQSYTRICTRRLERSTPATSFPAPCRAGYAAGSRQNRWRTPPHQERVVCCIVVSWKHCGGCSYCCKVCRACMIVFLCVFYVRSRSTLHRESGVHQGEDELLVIGGTYYSLYDTARYTWCRGCTV